MGWYDEVWTRRAAISVDTSGGAASGDVDVTIPKGLDDFWGVIDASGNELRVVGPDSQTLQAYAIDNGSGGAFNATTRLGRIRLDAVTFPTLAGSTMALWLYYGSTSTQGSGAGATGAGSIAGYVDYVLPSMHRFVHSAQIPQHTRPRTSIHKRVNEEVYVNFDFSQVLQMRGLPGYKSNRYEEPWYATATVEDSGGAAQASMVDASRNRFIQAGRNQLYYSVLVKAGTTATPYTVVADLRTRLPGASTAHQRLISSVGLYVRDVRYS
jgi:hypothetical protein